VLCNEKNNKQPCLAFGTDNLQCKGMQDLCGLLSAGTCEQPMLCGKLTLMRLSKRHAQIIQCKYSHRTCGHQVSTEHGFQHVSCSLKVAGLAKHCPASSGATVEASQWQAHCLLHNACDESNSDNNKRLKHAPLLPSVN